MDTITLDTNILRDWAWCEGRSSERRYNNDLTKRKELRVQIQKLRYLRNHNHCELAITNQIYTDYQNDVLPAHIDAMIGRHVEFAVPSISTLPFRLPTVIVDMDKIDAIFADIFPHSRPEHTHYVHNRKDAKQIYAHIIAKRDYFITSDRELLAAHLMLKTKWDVQILSLEQYLSKYSFNLFLAFLIAAHAYALDAGLRMRQLPKPR